LIKTIPDNHITAQYIKLRLSVESVF
jgi:hypothetical protein